MATFLVGFDFSTTFDSVTEFDFSALQKKTVAEALSLIKEIGR